MCTHFSHYKTFSPEIIYPILNYNVATSLHDQYIKILSIVLLLPYFHYFSAEFYLNTTTHLMEKQCTSWYASVGMYLSSWLIFLFCHQNWFRATTSQMISGNKSKVPDNDGIKAEVKNGATTAKKRGRKPKEHLLLDEPLQTKAEALTTTQNSTPPTGTPPSGSAQPPALVSDPTDNESPVQNRQPVPSATRRSKPKKIFLPE